jgi:protein-S-isoprenylcysteine O-methyltransferase Ste14
MPFLENKIPPPLAGLLIGGAMWAAAPALPVLALSDTLRLGLAAMLALAGIAFALAGVISFQRAQTTVNPLKPDSASALVQSGVFRLTRNPMYVGMALVLVGWAAFLASPWTLLGPVAFVWFIQRFQIVPEERAMEKLFGEEFARYRARVRRWI